MTRVRCLICRRQMQTLKSLTTHYMKGHSKMKIVKKLLQVSVSRLSPLLRHRMKGKLRKKPTKLRKKIEFNSKSLQTETLYLNDNFRILCGQNEIIIGDTKSNIDMEFSFEETSLDSKENCTSMKGDPNISTSDCTLESRSSEEYSKLCSPSASSEGSAASFKFPKKKIKRKKGIRRKLSHYCIDIMKLQDLQSLDDKNGNFYTCHCREKSFKRNNVSQKTDLRIVTSDTESCSDTSKNTFMSVVDTKVFCNKCGSGYRTESELRDHMYVHEPFCRLCNISFPCEFSFKQHMQLHIFRIFICHICLSEFPFREMLLRHFDCHLEDHTFETVLDMEEEYKIYRYNFMTKNYHSSINSIICFLSERPDFYYCGNKYSKVGCENCYNDVHLQDYDQHVQMCHNNKFF